MSVDPRAKVSSLSRDEVSDGTDGGPTDLIIKHNNNTTLPSSRQDKKHPKKRLQSQAQITNLNIPTQGGNRGELGSRSQPRKKLTQQ